MRPQGLPKKGNAIAWDMVFLNGHINLIQVGDLMGMGPQGLPKKGIKGNKKGKKKHKLILSRVLV